jgi:hypothetical protein
LHKREAYDYEREIRSVQVFPHHLRGEIHNTGLTLDQLGAFIWRIIVAPGSRPMFLHAVQTAITGVFNIGGRRFSGSIDRSSLDSFVVPQDE